jgi:hypothetical protein
MTQFDLYLGQDIPGGDTVSDQNILDFLRYDALLECFTLIKAQGSWNGKQEETTILRILEPISFYSTAQTIARKYKEAFSQEAVFLTATNVRGELI